jgi:dihydrofolate reductase
MTEIIITVAVAENNVIGKNGDIPWNIPEDLKHFKELTMGNPVIMGRKTYESLPKRPLKGRLNIVLTRREDYIPEGAIVKHSLKEAIEYCKEKGYEKIFIAGGHSVYKQALHLTDRIELTWVHERPEGDTHFPEIDFSKWKVIKREEHDGYSFVSYTMK